MFGFFPFWLLIDVWKKSSSSPFLSHLQTKHLLKKAFDIISCHVSRWVTQQCTGINSSPASLEGTLGAHREGGGGLGVSGLQRVSVCTGRGGAWRQLGSVMGFFSVAFAAAHVHTRPHHHTHTHTHAHRPTRAQTDRSNSKQAG